MVLVQSVKSPEWSESEHRSPPTARHQLNNVPQLATPPSATMRPNGSLSALVAGAQSISTRRLILFLGGILVLSTTLLLFTSVNLSTESLRTVSLEIPDSIKGKLHVPTVFKPATHTPPPPAKNSTASTEGWFASWSWMNPFSSGQGDRIALPPIERCSIYTYYEPPEDKVQAVVEDKMLLAWRRVWWAYGFKPMILGPAEAKTSGFYEMVNRAPYVPAMKKELMRLLAWNYVDAGILVNYRVRITDSGKTELF